MLPNVLGSSMNNSPTAITNLNSKLVLFQEVRKRELPPIWCETFSEPSLLSE